MKRLLPALVMALLSYEVIDGVTKTCFYESHYGTHTLTVRSTELCPVAMEVDQP